MKTLWKKLSPGQIDPYLLRIEQCSPHKSFRGWHNSRNETPLKVTGGTHTTKCRSELFPSIHTQDWN